MRQILPSANWLGSHAHQGRSGTTLRRTAVCSSQVTQPTNAIWRSAPSATERNTSNNLTVLKQRAVKDDAGGMLLIRSAVGQKAKNSIRSAVGTVIADRPPLRSVRAEFPHTAPALGQ